MEMLASLEATTTCIEWNYCGESIAVGTTEGTIQVWTKEKGGTNFSCMHKWQAHHGPVITLIWGPPEYGDIISSSSDDGTLCLWEEIEDNDRYMWRKCTQFEEPHTSALSFRFANCAAGLKLVVAWANGHIKVYDNFDTLDLKRWQLQADFLDKTLVDGKSERTSFSGASIAWRPRVGAVQQPVFVLAYRNSCSFDSSAKVWEFLDAYQRWSVVAELGNLDEDGQFIHCLSWATNIGRPYELIAVGSSTGVHIWHLEFSQKIGEKTVAKRVAKLTEHLGEVWQVEWDMSGMTLASYGSDGVVRLWQSNIDGVWQQQAIVKNTED